MPIHDSKDDPATEKDWKNAEENSLKKARFAIQGIGMEKDGAPACGEIEDTDHFYDFFYLLSPGVWNPVIEHTNADKVYVFPETAYSAKYVVESEAVKGNRELCMLRTAFMQAAVETMAGKDVFVLDCSTMGFEKFDMHGKETV